MLRVVEMIVVMSTLGSGFCALLPAGNVALAAGVMAAGGTIRFNVLMGARKDSAT